MVYENDFAILDSGVRLRVKKILALMRSLSEDSIDQSFDFLLKS